MVLKYLRAKGYFRFWLLSQMPENARWRFNFVFWRKIALNFRAGLQNNELSFFRIAICAIYPEQSREVRFALSNWRKDVQILNSCTAFISFEEPWHLASIYSTKSRPPLMEDFLCKYHYFKETNSNRNSLEEICLDGQVVCDVCVESRGYRFYLHRAWKIWFAQLWHFALGRLHTNP